MKTSDKYGSVPLVVAFLLTAVVIVGAMAPGHLLPAFGAGLMLPLFAGGLTFLVLRAQVPKRFHPAWALVGFPLMIGLTILTGSVLRESSPASTGSNSGSALFWMFPFLFATVTFQKSGCATSCRIQRWGMILFGCLLVVPVGIAGWLVWDAVQTGQGRLYTALPSLLQFAGIWTAAMMVVGVLTVATMGLRQRPETDASPLQV